MCRQRSVLLVEHKKITHRFLDSTMLLATHSADKQLRLYRIGVEFQQTRISITHMQTINNCSPLDYDGSNSLTKACQISHLEFVPPGPETRNREAKDAFIIAVFSQDTSQEMSILGEALSILSRWELNSVKPRLHPSFGQLTSKKPGTSTSSILPVCPSTQPVIWPE